MVRQAAQGIAHDRYKKPHPLGDAAFSFGYKYYILMISHDPRFSAEPQRQQIAGSSPAFAAQAGDLLHGFDDLFAGIGRAFGEIDGIGGKGVSEPVEFLAVVEP